MLTVWYALLGIFVLRVGASSGLTVVIIGGCS